LPLFNETSFFFLFENVVLYSFTVVVLIVYYKIPSSYGLVVLRKHSNIRNLNKRETGTSYARPTTINENNDDELVLEDLAIDDASENKVKRNS
jgi:hypothetical protein